MKKHDSPNGFARFAEAGFLRRRAAPGREREQACIVERVPTAAWHANLGIARCTRSGERLGRLPERSAAAMTQICGRLHARSMASWLRQAASF